MQISIWNGTDWETSGDVFCANEPPKDICVDSKDVMIHFISDNIITKRGFKAVYEIRGKFSGTVHYLCPGLALEQHWLGNPFSGLLKGSVTNNFVLLKGLGDKQLLLQNA